MRRLVYVPATSKAEISLDGPKIWTQDGAAGIRGRSWARKLGYRSLLQANRPAREVSITVYASRQAADLLRRAADADVTARKPGTFVFDGRWRQGGYILECEPTPYRSGVMLDLTLALVDGAWWTLVTNSFAPDDGTAYEYLDYPHDYEYDFSAPIGGNAVETGLLTPSPVFLRVYGPAVNPYVVVGKNRYQVNVSVPTGGYLVVDGRKKTITVTTQGGTTTNAFQYGERGSGAGGGEYVFEDIPSGLQQISWDGSFGFDLGWYDMEGEPPWSQS